MKSFCIETRNLTKISDRKLVNNINFTAYSGEIHTIIGSNGEGKTVFAKLLAGVRSKTSGSILLDGQKIDIHDVRSAQEHGIYMVQQEQIMFPTLSVRDNIIAGSEHIAGTSRIWAPSRKKEDQLCRRYMDMFELDFDLNAPISTLTTAEKRFIQLIRVLIRSPRVLILDEFASCLTYAETEHVFHILEELKQQMAIIFITHNYSVLLRYSDRVTIINDGTNVASFGREEFNEKPFLEHVESMKLNFTYPSLRLSPGRELVHVEHFSNDLFHDADFSLHEGEIIGLAGLSSLERASLVSAITGDTQPVSGSITFPGCQKRPAINVVGENDTDMAVFTSQTIPFNITASNFNRTTTFGFTSNKKMRLYARHYLDRLNFRNVSPDTKTQHLSTGSKQKLIIARSLFNNSNIYIYNEPSKNLDAVSRLELYNMLNALIMEKATVLLISSDFAELIGMCSRIVLMKGGRQIANYSTNYLSVKALSNALE